ncbi:dihydropteroate synthase [Nocardia tengchongensis]|uniref:dihydropteroate synthase n=1 Tax=Nocardia tengchongensis TaxID=2055889 RepID=UPI00368FA59E
MNAPIDLRRLAAMWPPRLDRDVDIVSVVNTSPDSYFAGSVTTEVAAAVAAARLHIQQGAHFIEIGGVSGGSAAERVNEDIELARTVPFVEAIAAEFPQVTVTIDTYRPKVAEAALAVGARAINDVTAMHFAQSEMADLAAQHQVPVFLMHLEGPGGHAGRKLNRPRYNDVVGQIKGFFIERIETLTAAGIAKDQIVIDVGLGAGKRPFHDYELLASLHEFSKLGVAQMSACSRKQLVQAVSPVPPDQRLGGSIVASMWSVIAGGCRYLRVHEVQPYAQMLDVWDAIAQQVDAACAPELGM